ncbi:MAG: aminotransferase class I/II-fold pyridoxal phosphate-dependent enzyme [Coriobacteriia bacterium]|nr:aminotransferase class I/II-fold pyridoxal phosphate-dependent enzyme [Coriobacteriia bacterium]
MYEYSHGGNAAFEHKGKAVLDLSANINPLGLPAQVRAAVIDAIAGATSYPDSFSYDLCQAIGGFEQLDADWVFCGNGASDIIFRLPRAVGARSTLLTAPSFSDYERAALSYGSEVVLHPLSRNDGFYIDAGIVDTICQSQADLVFICNPNNPTGVLTDLALLEQVLIACQSIGSTLVVDECFMDFVGNADEYSCKALLHKYQNLVVLKAFTKIFAMPGIRLGYALCANQELRQRLYFHGADWPVSNLAQAAGAAALTDAPAYISATQSFVLEERLRMQAELKRLGFKAFDSRANYVFIQNPYPFDLSVLLDKQGIRIRSCANYHTLDEAYLRIAVSTKENNSLLLHTIASITEAYLQDGVGQPSDALVQMEVS